MPAEQQSTGGFLHAEGQPGACWGRQLFQALLSRKGQGCSVSQPDPARWESGLRSSFVPSASPVFRLLLHSPSADGRRLFPPLSQYSTLLNSYICSDTCVHTHKQMYPKPQPMWGCALNLKEEGELGGAEDHCAEKTFWRFFWNGRNRRTPCLSQGLQAPHPLPPSWLWPFPPSASLFWRRRQERLPRRACPVRPLAGLSSTKSAPAMDRDVPLCSLRSQATGGRRNQDRLGKRLQKPTHLPPCPVPRCEVSSRA